jgi:hypothetical protein
VDVSTTSATPPMATPSPSTTPSSTMTMSEGGNVGGFFSGWNWLEVGLTILGVSTMYYVVYYYRFKLQQDKMVNNELQRQIDEIRINLKGNLKDNYQNI